MTEPPLAQPRADARLGGRTGARDILYLLILALALRLPTLAQAEINYDASSFALVGREILAGNWPFTTVFDHKPIATYLHYAAVIALFGESPVAINLLSWAADSATALLLRLALIRLYGLRRAWGLLLPACFLVASIGLGSAAAYSELLVNVYMCASAYWLLSRRIGLGAFLSGAAAGIAVNCNYLAAGPCSGMILGYVLAQSLSEPLPRSSIFAAAAAWAAGFIVAVVTVLSPIFLLSQPSAYFGPQWSFLGGYSAWSDPRAAAMVFLPQAAQFLPIAGTLAALAWLVSRRGSQRDRDPRDRALLIVPLCMGAGALLAALASGYAFNHYFLLLLPPLWLATAACLRREPGRPAEIMTGAAVAGTSLMFAASSFVTMADGAYDLASKAAKGDLRRDPARKLAAMARPHVEAGETIYLACTSLAPYLLLEAQPPTRFAFYAHMLNPTYAKALKIDIDAEIAAIFERRPAVVILGSLKSCWAVPPSSYEKLQRALVANGYEVFAEYSRYQLYRVP